MQLIQETEENQSVLTKLQSVSIQADNEYHYQDLKSSKSNQISQSINNLNLNLNRYKKDKIKVKYVASYGHTS